MYADGLEANAGLLAARFVLFGGRIGTSLMQLGIDSSKTKAIKLKVSVGCVLLRSELFVLLFQLESVLFARP